MRTTHRGVTIGAGLVVAAVLCLGLGPIAAAEPKDARQATDPLLESLDMQYVKQITKHLGTIGRQRGWLSRDRNPAGRSDRELSGRRDGRRSAWRTCRRRVAHHRRLAVQRRIRDEPKGGGLDRTFRVSSLGGVPGTSAGGASGRIVPVGYGTAPEYEGLDVEGKIAFAWWDYDNLGIWPNYIAYEAHAHGAEAVIIASAPGNGWYTAGGGRALGGNDGECSTTRRVPRWS